MPLFISIVVQQMDARAKKAAEIAAAKRKAELELKNPNTTAWEKHKERKIHFEETRDDSLKGTEKEAEGSYLAVHQAKIFTKRNERKEKRQDRRNQRKKIDLVNC